MSPGYQPRRRPFTPIRGLTSPAHVRGVRKLGVSHFHAEIGSRASRLRKPLKSANSSAVAIASSIAALVGSVLINEYGSSVELARRSKEPARESNSSAESFRGSISVP